MHAGSAVPRRCRWSSSTRTATRCRGRRCSSRRRRRGPRSPRNRRRRTPAGSSSVGCTLSTHAGAQHVCRPDSGAGERLGASSRSPVRCREAPASIGCVRCALTRTVGTQLDPRALQSLQVTVVDSSGLPGAGGTGALRASDAQLRNVCPVAPRHRRTPTSSGSRRSRSWQVDTLARSDTVFATVQGFANNPQPLVVVGVADVAGVLGVHASSHRRPCGSGNSSRRFRSRYATVTATSSTSRDARHADALLVRSRRAAARHDDRADASTGLRRSATCGSTSRWVKSRSWRRSPG